MHLHLHLHLQGWESLPPSVQAQLGNNPKEYDKLIGQFSIRNQLR